MSTTAERRAATAGPFHWRFTSPLFLGSALNPINSSLIATALVPIGHGIHVSTAQTAGLVSSLYLASAIAQPTAGKLSEVLGPRRVFLGGIMLVMLGGILGGLGDSLAALIVARVLLGIGTSGGYPSAMLMIRRRAGAAGLDAPPGGVLGGLQIAAIGSMVLGLPLGGVLADGLGWRATFLVNVPVTLITLAAAFFWLPRDPKPDAGLSARGIATAIDATGILGFAAAMAAILIFINSLPNPHWAFLAAGLVIGAALVAWELRITRPFIDIRLLAANLALTRTYLRFGLTSLCAYTVLYGLSAWLEAAHDYSAETVGLLMLPMAALSGAVMQPVAKRNMLRPALLAASGSAIVGSLLILTLSTTSPVWLVIVITLVFGVTLGTYAPSNQTALYQQAAADQIGTAAGLLRTFGYIGSIASSAIVSIVFHARVSDHGMHIMGAVMIAAGAAGIVMVLGDRSLGRRA